MSAHTTGTAPAPLPMSAASITDAEVASVTAALRSGCLSLGTRLREFERQIEAITGARHAVGVSSGTAGLHLAVIAAGIGPGDLAITTPFSFVASSNCLLYERACPVFVDVDPVTGNIDAALVMEAAADLRAGGAAADRWLPRPWRGRARPDGALKAILPVHAFGQPAEMDPLWETATLHGLAVIEDACEAIGAEYRSRRAGRLGDAGVFGFYPNKQVTTGEGGMIVTDRDDWAERFRSLRNQGRDVMDAWLQHERLGYNYRLDELSAALGVAQCARLDELLAGRDRVAQWYFDRLADAHAVVCPAILPSTTRMSWFAFVVRLEAGCDRSEVMAALAARGVPSRAYFSPIHLQPFYASRFDYRRGDFPVAEALGDACLALPFSSAMTEAAVDRVCRELRAAVGSMAERSAIRAPAVRTA